MANFTLLTRGQATYTWGYAEDACSNDSFVYPDYSGKLPILSKFGVRAELTDFAILSGALHNEKRIGEYCFKDDFGTINWNGRYEEYYCDFRYSRTNGIRVVLPIDAEIENMVQENKYYLKKETKSRTTFIPKVKYGTYPQLIAPHEIQKIIELEYQNLNLKTTGNYFTVDKNKPTILLDYTSEGLKGTFYPCRLTEYLFEGRRYVRLENRAFTSPLPTKLSDGRIYNYQSYKYVWVEVSPVEWLIDVEKGLLVSEKLLLSNINFASGIYNDLKNNQKWFLNNIFANELMQQTYTSNNQVALDDIETIKNPVPIKRAPSVFEILRVCDDEKELEENTKLKRTLKKQ